MSSSVKRNFGKGEMLMREGEIGEIAYIIESGSVEILVMQEGTLIQIGTRGPGSIIGEMAMIDDKPRTASVRVVEDCEVLEISRDDFSRRVEHADPVLKMVMHVVMSRYRDLLGRMQFVGLPLMRAERAEALENLHESHDRALGAIKIHNELSAALKRDELTLFYQPIIDLQNMKLAGFEALMRWIHPERGMISPGVFIPVAEESGLIVPMTRLALNKSCDDLKALEAVLAPGIAPSGEPLFMSVNFSVKDFVVPDTFDYVSEAVRARGLDPMRIHVEITESLLMEAQEAARTVLNKFRSYGFGISIDDFGSGYSSLGYLHRFPIDTLKIDQSFIRAMSSGGDEVKTLVKAIIAMAHALDMHVIAEGIETKEDAQKLREYGCAFGQGYWFAKPMPAEDAKKFAAEWQPPTLDAGAENA